MVSLALQLMNVVLEGKHCYSYAEYIKVKI